MAAVSAFGLVYAVSLLLSASDVEANYVGFMRQGASGTVLPVFLMMMCLGHVRYDVFELVRRNPLKELYANFLWLVLSAVVCACCGAMLFAFMEFVVYRQPVSARHWSLTFMLLVQSMMMNASVGLIQMLLAYMGCAWEYVTPLLMGLFVIAHWLLNPLPGDVLRIVCYFWFPIGDDWGAVVSCQIVPFCGFAMLMSLVVAKVFSVRDHLDGRR